MNFKEWIISERRDDLTLVNRFSDDTEEAYDKLYRYYANMLNVLFPKKSRNEDTHDYVMRLWDGLKFYRNEYPTIKGHKIIVGRCPNNFKAFTGQDLDGEAIGNDIYLYPSEIYKLIYEIIDVANNYIWAVREDKPKKKTEYWNAAQNLHKDLIVALDQEESDLKKIIYHELVHVERHQKNPITSTPLKQATRNNILTRYVNNPSEMDAYFLDRAKTLLRNERGRSVFSFQDLLQKFWDSFTREHLDFLDEKNRRKWISRLYQLYYQDKMA